MYFAGYLYFMDLINERTMEQIKIINDLQAKSKYASKNTKQKLLKTKAAIWFNEMCRLNHLTLKYEGWNFNSGNYLFTTDTK